MSLKPDLATVGLISFLLTLLAGCASEPETPPPPPMVSELKVTQQVGGMHHVLHVHGNGDAHAWYQAFGSDLLVLDTRSARVLETIELGVPGESAPLTALATEGERLFALLDGQEVIEFSLRDPQQPRMVTRESADALGVSPRTLSIVDGELYVSGEGGVVRWSDLQRVFIAGETAGRVIESSEGLVVCVDRRVYQIEGGAYVGSASDLVPATLERIEPDTLVFLRQGERGALVGLMNRKLRELDSAALTVAVPGQVRNVRVFMNRVWAVTDDEIAVYAVFEEALRRVRTIDVLGARDVMQLDENHLAVCGGFGRAIYRLRSSERGPGDTFLYGHREPSRLTWARSDGRYILAGSELGHWLYLIGSRVEISDLEIDPEEPDVQPAREAGTVVATARISDDGRALVLRGEDGQIEEHREPEGARIHCVMAVDGEFWLGHDRGITVLKADGHVDRLRLNGPVRYLFPLRTDRGVAFVAEFGGFGIAQYVDRPALSSELPPPNS